ncbi:MAG: hypothetical protein LBK60_01475 [Verrucomicrobiales bacterium]|jgi:hypothetical protein|nr:hypothetical protein [Verrucomicrobiales bacterium]
MNYFGDDFDVTQPAGNSPVRDGDNAIRDVKQRLKSWINQFFNGGGETFKAGIIPAAALADSGAEPGVDYNLVTVDAKGRVTAARKVTSLTELGVLPEAIGMVPPASGGTGLDAKLAGHGTLLIGNGAGFSLATLTAGDGVEIVNGSGTIIIKTAQQTVAPFFKTTVLTSAQASAAVTLLDAAVVGNERKVVVTGFIFKVIGGVVWSENTVHLGTNNGAPIVSAPSSALTANNLLLPGDAQLTLSSRFTQGTGGEYGEGLYLRAEQNGTGSDLAVTVWGFLV